MLHRPCLTHSKVKGGKLAEAIGKLQKTEIHRICERYSPKHHMQSSQTFIKGKKFLKSIPFLDFDPYREQKK
jgi:hypothetical protein